MFFANLCFKMDKYYNSVEGYFTFQIEWLLFYEFMPTTDCIPVVLAGIRTAVTAQDAHLRF